MGKGKVSTGLIITLIATVVTGLSYIGWQVKVLLGICYNFAGYRILGFSNGDGTASTNPFAAKYLDMNISMFIGNSSVFSVKVVSYSFTAYLNEINIALLNNTVSQTIK